MNAKIRQNKYINIQGSEKTFIKREKNYDFDKKNAGEEIRTLEDTKSQDLESCPFDRSGTPAFND